MKKLLLYSHLLFLQWSHSPFLIRKSYLKIIKWWKFINNVHFTFPHKSLSSLKVEVDTKAARGILTDPALRQLQTPQIWHLSLPMVNSTKVTGLGISQFSHIQGQTDEPSTQHGLQQCDVINSHTTFVPWIPLLCTVLVFADHVVWLLSQR